MQKYQNTVQTRAGAVVPSASVLVLTYPALVPATIYIDNAVTTTGNPLTTDANGAFSFYAANGHYSLEISGTGLTTTTQSDVMISDLSTTTHADVTATAGQTVVSTGITYVVATNSLQVFRNGVRQDFTAGLIVGDKIAFYLNTGVIP